MFGIFKFVFRFQNLVIPVQKLYTTMTLKKLGLLEFIITSSQENLISFVEVLFVDTLCCNFDEDFYRLCRIQLQPET